MSAACGTPLKQFLYVSIETGRPDSTDSRATLEKAAGIAALAGRIPCLNVDIDH